MANYCAECLLLDLNDNKWGNEYYCTKKRKYVDPKSVACNYFIPRKQETGYKRSGCYITTIICTILNQPDDCDLLTTLRHFRDNYLKEKKEYLNLLLEYDYVGPIISKLLLQEPNMIQMAQDLTNIFLLPCYYLIKTNNFDDAIAVYKNMVTALKIRYNLFDIHFNKTTNIPLEELGKGRIRTS